MQFGPHVDTHVFQVYCVIASHYVDATTSASASSDIDSGRALRSILLTVNLKTREALEHISNSSSVNDMAMACAIAVYVGRVDFEDGAFDWAEDCCEEKFDDEVYARFRMLFEKSSESAARVHRDIALGNKFASLEEDDNVEKTFAPIFEKIR